MRTFKREAVDQKIGDQYAACMDEAAIEAKGITPLKPELEHIAALKSKAELPAELARLHSGGGNAAFRFGSQPDFSASSAASRRTSTTR